MRTVTVLRFSTDRGADDALGAIRDLQCKHLVSLDDAAIVAWPTGKKGPCARQRVSLSAESPRGGLFWALLLGLICFSPLLGVAVGVALGTLGGILGDYGIDDTFVRSVRAAFTPGTSAIFLLSDAAIADTVRARAPGLAFDVIATKPSTAHEPRLREVFARH